MGNTDEIWPSQGQLFEIATQEDLAALLQRNEHRAIDLNDRLVSAEADIADMAKDLSQLVKVRVSEKNNGDDEHDEILASVLASRTSTTPPTNTTTTIVQVPPPDPQHEIPWIPGTNLVDPAFLGGSIGQASDIAINKDRRHRLIFSSAGGAGPGTIADIVFSTNYPTRPKIDMTVFPGSTTPLPFGVVFSIVGVSFSGYSIAVDGPVPSGNIYFDVTVTETT